MTSHSAMSKFSRHASFEQICEVAEQERNRLYFESRSQPSSPTIKRRGRYLSVPSYIYNFRLLIILDYVTLNLLHRVQQLRGRASDSRLRETGLESCAAVLKPWASFFNRHCSS